MKIIWNYFAKDIYDLIQNVYKSSRYKFTMRLWISPWRLKVRSCRAIWRRLNLIAPSILGIRIRKARLNGNHVRLSIRRWGLWNRVSEIVNSRFEYSENLPIISYVWYCISLSLSRSLSLNKFEHSSTWTLCLTSKATIQFYNRFFIKISIYRLLLHKMREYLDWSIALLMIYLRLFTL